MKPSSITTRSLALSAEVGRNWIVIRSLSGVNALAGGELRVVQPLGRVAEPAGDVHRRPDRGPRRGAQPAGGLGRQRHGGLPLLQCVFRAHAQPHGPPADAEVEHRGTAEELRPVVVVLDAGAAAVPLLVAQVRVRLQPGEAVGPLLRVGGGGVEAVPGDAVGLLRVQRQTLHQRVVGRQFIRETREDLRQRGAEPLRLVQPHPRQDRHPARPLPLEPQEAVELLVLDRHLERFDQVVHQPFHGGVDQCVVAAAGLAGGFEVRLPLRLAPFERAQARQRRPEFVAGHGQLLGQAGHVPLVERGGDHGAERRRLLVQRVERRGSRRRPGQRLGPAGAGLGGEVDLDLHRPPLRAGVDAQRDRVRSHRGSPAPVRSFAAPPPSAGGRRPPAPRRGAGAASRCSAAGSSRTGSACRAGRSSATPARRGRTARPTGRSAGRGPAAGVPPGTPAGPTPARSRRRSSRTACAADP